MAEEKLVNVNGMDYIVSSDGRVYSTKNSARSYYHMELKQRPNVDGYMVITTGPNGHRRDARVHRIVAEAFIPNPNNLPEVNHKDCNRANNNVENLEWCTHIDNIKYSIDMGNHICTKDLTGSNNPNYGNDTLKKKYTENPELSQMNNSRPGSQNGRCREVKLTNIESGRDYYFSYIRQASKWLIDGGFTRAASVDSVYARITKSAQDGSIIYRKFKAELLN